jgi:hypothetical protein
MSRPSGHDGPQELCELVGQELQGKGLPLLKILHGAFHQPTHTGNVGYLNFFQRRLIIDTGEPAFNAQGWPTRTFLPKSRDEYPNRVLQKLHASFGGSLILNGKTLYKDGRLVGTMPSFATLSGGNISIGKILLPL